MSTNSGFRIQYLDKLSRNHSLSTKGPSALLSSPSEVVGGHPFPVALVLLFLPSRTSAYVQQGYSHLLGMG